MIPKSPSIGSLIKKILVINPDIDANEMIAMIRQATKTREVALGDCGTRDVVDEVYALTLAKETLKPKPDIII